MRTMWDALVIAIAAAFFALAFGLIRWFDHI